MNKIGFLLFFILLYANCLFSQLPQPGGVFGVKIWYASIDRVEEGTLWENLNTSSPQLFLPNVAQRNEEHKLLNFNPALYIDGTNQSFSVPLGQLDLSKTTIFSVYYPQDAYWEKTVWMYSTESKDQLILTTHRVGDLEDRKYMNFVPNRIDLPRINTYSHYKNGNTGQAGDQQLRFGNKSPQSILPVTAFKGLVPEFIVFDRVLSAEERIKVESFLALKYGITLLQHGPANYLNSTGETIWNGRENTPFFLNVTGIGRDDGSGLYQKQSTSSYAPGLLTIGAHNLAIDNAKNSAEFSNGSFLIWGDNNAPLTFQKEIQGQPIMLERKWLIERHGAMNAIPTSISFENDKIAPVTSTGDSYWLVVDRSGTGNFPLGSVEYLKMSAMQINGKAAATCSNFNWDVDLSGKDFFTLAAAPSLFSNVWVTAPMCNPQSNGQFHVGAIGGTPPYHFIITALQADFSYEWTSNSIEPSTIDNISPGDYLLILEDAVGDRYEEALSIQSLDAPKSNLQSNYTIRPGSTLRLNAGNYAGVNTQWTMPDGTVKYTSEIDINTPGTYLLTMNANGCISKQTIKVNAVEDAFIESINLFPNPVSIDGFFNITIMLTKKEAVDILIYDTQGRILQSRKLDANIKHYYTGMIETPGVYSIIVKSAGHTKTLQLVVE